MKVFEESKFTAINKIKFLLCNKDEFNSTFNTFYIST